MDSGIFSNINWLHVLVAAVAYFALGAIWYSFLFRNKWIAYQNIKMDETSSQKGVGRIMFAPFILMLIATIGLAIIVSRLQLDHFASGVKWGLLTGVCFSATAISITYLYIKKPAGLHLIDGLYHIVGQIIAAVILSCWH